MTEKESDATVVRNQLLQANATKLSESMRESGIFLIRHPREGGDPSGSGLKMDPRLRGDDGLT
jgi:hypothetical protein